MQKLMYAVPKIIIIYITFLVCYKIWGIFFLMDISTLIQNFSDEEECLLYFSAMGI